MGTYNNWQASGKPLEKGKQKHRKRQGKAKAFRLLAEKLRKGV